jgi:hypothetical protein
MSVSYPLIITQKNLLPGSTNTYRYNFSSNVDMGNIDIGLGSASVWFSWRNITAAKNNNTFQIIHPATLATNVTLTLTIPDGGYDINDLNNFLRYYLVNNGYYIQNNSTNEQIVYCKFQVNASTYQVEFVSYPLPTSLPTGFTAGSAITFPATTRAPQLVVNQVNFGSVIGFALGTFPSTQQTILTTTGSTLVPVVSDVTNVVLTLDSAMNPFAPNSKVIHSISPAGYKYASLINDQPSEISWVPQQSGWRQSITIQLTNQNLIPIEQYDTDVTIKLLLRMRDQSLLNR